MKFLHRLLTIIQLPQTNTILDLGNKISALLHQEIETYEMYVKKYDSCPFDSWEYFLGTQKGSIWKSKLLKSKSKYRMLHPVSQGQNAPSLDLLQSAIVQLVHDI